MRAARAAATAAAAENSLEIRPSKVLAGLYSVSAREYAELWAPVLQPKG